MKLSVDNIEIPESESVSEQDASSSKKRETEEWRRRVRGGESSSESEREGVGGIITEVGEWGGVRGVDGKEVGRERKDGIGGGGVDGRDGGVAE